MREGTGRKKIKRNQLSAAEVEEIVEAARTKGRTQKETAFNFGVSERLVSSLVVAARKDPMFLGAVRKREQKRREKLRAVVTEAQEQLRSKDGLLRACDV